MTDFKENKLELEFQEIYEMYQSKIHYYLSKMVGEVEAKDLTQEVFIKVHQSLDGFKGKSQLSTWIFRIATNIALDKFRNLSSHRKSQEFSYEEMLEGGDSLLEDENGWIREKSISTDQQLIKKEMNACIRDFIDNLPEDYRAVVILSEIEELKNQEVAEILGITLDNVKIRLYRARAKLNKVLETHCRFYRNEQNVLACDLKNAYKHFREAE